MSAQSALSVAKVHEAVSRVELKDLAQEEDKLFEFLIIKPSDILKFERSGKIKKAIQDHIGWHYRPRSQFENERIDYNCLNILAEYQTYNLEMCRNDLELSNKQTAMVLDLFWQLLEFDPDVEADEQLHLKTKNTDDDILDA